MNNPILVTGGCGFVGRHVVQHILNHAISEEIWLVDDLFTGRHPEEWLPPQAQNEGSSGRVYSYRVGPAAIHFIHDDVRHFFSDSVKDHGSPVWRNLSAVIHLASVVGGRSLIDGDPLLVATDLAIDAEMFHWARTVKPERILYASSSAAYPVHLQGEQDAIALRESEITFGAGMGLPDMTYGWSKLTGEYLSRVAARHYRLHVACIRPFSGYGEDQETVYPVPAIAERCARREDPLIVWGTGQQARDFVYIDDCVDMMFRAMDEIRDGSAVNIGSGKLTCFLDVARTFANIAGYSPKIQPQIDKPVGVQNRYADTTLLSEKFHWAPRTSMTEGFSRVFEMAKRRIERQERFRIVYDDSHRYHHN